MIKRNKYLYLITIIVALCSIIYELLFSQMLTIIFGGAVVRYSITIGLYLFFLGIGAFYFEKIKKGYRKYFLHIEILLSLIGPLGVIFIIYLNSVLSGNTLLIISHLPIILVGFLSGLEIPLLVSLTKDKSSGFSSILGFDYIGSLIGTILFALVLYPLFGIISTAIFIGFLNFTVALAISLRYKNIKKIMFLFWIIYLAILVNSNHISKEMTSFYLEETVQRNYEQLGIGTVSAQVSEVFQTKYQTAYFYTLNISDTPYPVNDYCLNLDNHPQLCESWVKEYHAGLIDVPMNLINKTNAQVLLIGGGDWIAINYLKKYSPIIDHVDIDEKFANNMRTHEWVSKYHNDSFDYPNLTTYIQDGYTYAKNTNKTYDIIILDLPGLRSDKLISLYSLEFYNSLKNILKENGILTTWTYTKKDSPEFNDIYLATVKEAGFNFAKYYSELGSKDFPIEYYYIFSKNQKDDFEEIEESDTRINSLFAPNLKMIVE